MRLLDMRGGRVVVRRFWGIGGLGGDGVGHRQGHEMGFSKVGMGWRWVVWAGILQQ